MKQGGVLSVGRGWGLDLKFQISNFKLLKLLALLSLAVLCVSAASHGARARQTETAKQAKGEARTLYRVSLELDFEARSYAGRERVRWVNRDDRATSVLYFHLYPNLRAEDERPGAPPAPDSAAPEEPRLEVTRVSASASSTATTAPPPPSTSTSTPTSAPKPRRRGASRPTSFTPTSPGST